VSFVGQCVKNLFEFELVWCVYGEELEEKKKNGGERDMSGSRGSRQEEGERR